MKVYIKFQKKEGIFRISMNLKKLYQKNFWAVEILTVVKFCAVSLFTLDWKQNLPERWICTTHAAINRTGKTNARKGEDGFNSYKEFHEWEVKGHVIAAFMVFCGMQSMEGVSIYICIVTLL